MLDPRLYRVAFVPVLLAVLVAAFSLGNRPRPIGTTLAPDAFDGARAAETLDDLTRAFPVRRPGDAADDRLASGIANEFRRLIPGTVAEQRFRAGTIDGERELVNVVATRPGAPGPGIVVVAHRDAAGRGAKAELSGTAALLELARVAGDGRLRRTITFISTSGGSGGFAGASEAARRLVGQADAVLVLGAVGSARTFRPFVVPWSNGRGAAPMRLRRTVENAVRAEVGTEPGNPRALAQWARLAVPATISEQGPFLRAGQPAVLLSASGERPPTADAAVRQRRLQAFGRAALRTLYALDNGPDIAEPPTSDLVVRGKVLPGWAVRLLVGVLLLPPLVSAIDGFARLRRRHEAVGRWMRWTIVGVVPFAIACVFAILLGLVGLIPVAPGAPIPGIAMDVGAGAIAAMIAIVLVFALGWLARPALLRAVGATARPTVPGASMGVALTTCAVAVVMWLVNPYAAALVVPATHLWLWATVPEARIARPIAVVLVLSALLPLAAVAVSDARLFQLGAIDAAWFWTQLLAGGHVPALAWLLWSAFWACAVAAALVTLQRPSRKEADEQEVTVRGPVSYAGPGSLGGTESALRR